MSSLRQLLLLVFVAQVKVAAFADQRPGCALLLFHSKVMLATPVQGLEDDNWSEAYINLLNLVLEGIDEITTNAFGHAERAQVKTLLLSFLVSTDAPVNPLNGLQTNYSPKLSTLAESGQLDFVIENLSDKDWREIRQATQQKLVQLQETQAQQAIAKPATQKDFIDEVDANKENRLFHMIRAKRFNEVIPFLETTRTPVRYINQVNRFGQTPLDILLSIDKDHELTLLLESKGALQGAILRDLETKLLEAVEYNDIEQIKYLYNRGVDLNRESSSSLAGSLPLFVAAMAIDTKGIKTLKTLLELGVNTERTDQRNRTALVSAIDGASVAAIRILIEAKANLNVTYMGINIFEFAMSLGRTDLMRLFADIGFSTRISKIFSNKGRRVTSSGKVVNFLRDLVDLNAKTLHGGRALLHEAVVQHDILLVHAMLANGADPELRDDQGNTPSDLNLDMRFFSAEYATRTRTYLLNAINKKRGRSPPASEVAP